MSKTRRVCSSHPKSKLTLQMHLKNNIHKHVSWRKGTPILRVLDEIKEKKRIGKEPKKRSGEGMKRLYVVGIVALLIALAESAFL